MKKNKTKCKAKKKQKLLCEINLGICKGCIHVSPQGVCCANDPDDCPRKQDDE